jgi:drug/metabolite transporter (DMT)-like permease
MAQFAVASLLLGPRRVRRALTTRFRTLQLGRSLGFAVHTVLFIAAITFLPLADAIALLFVGPLMVTALSAPLLGERVSMPRWLGVLIGFVGAMVIIRPGFGVFHWATTLVLLSAACFALYQIATRELSNHEDPLTTLFYTPVAGLVAMSGLTPFYWTTPTFRDALLMALMGTIGAFAHFMLIKAYETAEASSLAPFSYVLIVSATILGYAVFGDLPDAWTVMGTLIVVAGGLYVGYREARIERPPAVSGGRSG